MDLNVLSYHMAHSSMYRQRKIDRERMIEREKEMGLYIYIWSSPAEKLDLDGWLSGTAPWLAHCQACSLVAWPAS